MHGRSKMAAAPASDVVTREGHCCLHIREASRLVFFLFFSWLALIRVDLRGIKPTRVDSGRINLYQSKPLTHAEIKKKKRCKTHRFGRNNKTLTNLTWFILLIFNSLSLVSVLSVSLLSVSSLSHSVTHTISLSTHSHTHTISLSTHSQPHRPTLNLKFSTQLKSQLSSSTHSQESQLKYQTKAFNLSYFSIFLSSSWSDFFSLKLTSPDLFF